MKRTLLPLALLVLLMTGGFQYGLHPSWTSHSLDLPTTKSVPLLLVPLDGRPPCRQFVIDAGKIAGYEVLTPPSSLQDYYSQPGEPEQMREWVLRQVEGSHALILSIDQLLYGGLLAAREKTASPEEIQTLLSFLRKLHADHPTVPIYAFSILPRLTPQDTIDGYHERRDLMEYSRLMGKQASGLPVDTGRLQALKEKIPAESLQKYLQHFEENTALNKSLADLAQEGILTRLILGQDDGEEYSIPNIEKKKLQQYLASHGISEEQVFLTHGADEIALTLLAEIKSRETAFRPRIFLQWNDEKTAARIMPYMAVNTGTAAEEKIRMLRGRRAASPEDADFVLFLSTIDSEEDGLSSRRPSIATLRTLLAQGTPTALVDLSKHFQEAETLFPLMVREDLPINRLIAYAGWNTASNSIGTALAQSVLFCASRQQAKTQEDVLRLYAANLTFLQNRCLEDSFYLKDVIDRVNASLKKAGYINTADLDLEHNYRWANAMLQAAMKQRLLTYKETKAFREPIPIETPAGPLRLRLRDLTADMSYPWPRTFEIHLQSVIWLDMVD